MNYKVYGEAHGCPSNFADFEIALGLLKKAGFEIANSIEKSDLNIIFTCTVKVPSLNRMVDRIAELTNSSTPLIVAGCMPKTEKEIIEKINPKASMIGPDSIEKIVDVASATIEGKKIVFLEDLRKPKLCLPRIRRNPVVNIIPISIGCRSNCSYCSVKLARGNLFSYPVSSILKETEQGLKEGCKEVWITSQDCGCWGMDIGLRLPYLLNEIVKIQGEFFVRVGMTNPLHLKDILCELIEAYKNEKIFKFLHVPVQSGSDRILNLMNRSYTVKDFVNIIEKFRKEFPRLTISTDIIVGFPSEDSSDFELTLDLIRKFKFDVVNISKFGSRANTLASKMKQIDRETINERTKVLFELVRKTQLEINKEWIDWTGKVLVDEKGKDKTWIGRNFAYKPIVFECDQSLLGKFVEIRVTDAKSNYLIGEMN